MIVYGWRGSNLKNGQIPNVKCPKCDETCSMNYASFGKYTHIYFIPLFPYQKKNFVECEFCKCTFDKKSFTTEMVTKLDREYEKNGKPRLPIWMFSGSIIIALLIGYFYTDGKRIDKEEDKFIKEPKIGDVYHIKLDNGHFSTFRIDKVNRDNVDITLNDYETNLMSDVSEIDISKNYTKNKISISPLRLFSLYQQDTIYTIEREEQ